MRKKDDSVETEFHPILTAFLFELDNLYRHWNTELIVTSGSERATRHSRTSLHYNIPAQAADLRSKISGRMPKPELQAGAISRIAAKFCKRKCFPVGWIEVILESNHIHIEYQPKRLAGI